MTRNRLKTIVLWSVLLKMIEILRFSLKIINIFEFQNEIYRSFGSQLTARKNLMHMHDSLRFEDNFYQNKSVRFFFFFFFFISLIYRPLLILRGFMVLNETRTMNITTFN